MGDVLSVRLAADGVSAVIAPQRGAARGPWTTIVIRRPFPNGAVRRNVHNGRFSFEGRDHRTPRNNGPHAPHGLVDDVAWDIVEAG